MRPIYRIIIPVICGGILLATCVWYEVRTIRRMRAAVELALEMNRNYVPFTSDTVLLDVDSSIINHHFSFINPRRISLRSVVAYYDYPLRFWVSANDRLRAHYALGCVYRDLHEAPMALLSWEDAIACADTTSAACDFSTLFRVYGQMEEVYYRQYMPEKELEAQQKFCDYALQAGDTLVFIRGLLQRNEAYLSLGDTAAVFRNIEIVRNLYLERGLTQEAAQVYPSAIRVALDRGNFEKADSMMRIYEQESGLFDEYGNIARSREIYYYYKGCYFLNISQLDSAEHQFRRLLYFQDNLVDAYRGLVAVYQSKFNKDSLLKYSTLHEDALVDYLEETQTQAISQAEGMYDYSRQEQQAKVQKKKVRWLTYAIVLILSLTSLSFLFYRSKRLAREQQLQQLMQSYLQTRRDLRKSMDEVSFLRQHLPELEASKQLLAEKERELQKMEELTRHYRERLASVVPENDDEKLMNSEVVQLMRDICRTRSSKDNGHIRILEARTCSADEWNALQDAIQKYHFSFYYMITVEKKLPKLQYRVCVFSRLGFSTNEMAVLLGTTIQNVSNARSRAVKRLFDSDDTSLLDTQLSKL